MTTTVYDEVKARFGTGPAYKSIGDFTKWHGYANGQHLGEFATLTDATMAGAAATEKVVDREGYNAAKAEYRAFHTNVDAAWREEIRKKYVDGVITPEIVDIALNEAWERGHSSGHGEVEMYVDDYIDMFEKVIKVAKLD